MQKVACTKTHIYPQERKMFGKGNCNCNWKLRWIIPEKKTESVRKLLCKRQIIQKFRKLHNKMNSKLQAAWSWCGNVEKVILNTTKYKISTEKFNKLVKCSCTITITMKCVNNQAQDNYVTFYEYVVQIQKMFIIFQSKYFHNIKQKCTKTT